MPRTRSTTVAASPAAALETVVAAIAGIQLPAGNVIDLDCSLDLTIGTAGTATTLRLRRGTDATGALVSTAYGPFTTAAASRFNLSFNTFDTLATDQANVGYVLTVQVANATAQSTVNSVCLWATY